MYASTCLLWPAQNSVNQGPTRLQTPVNLHTPIQLVQHLPAGGSSCQWWPATATWGGPPTWISHKTLPDISDNHIDAFCEVASGYGPAQPAQTENLRKSQKISENLRKSEAATERAFPGTSADRPGCFSSPSFSVPPQNIVYQVSIHLQTCRPLGSAAPACSWLQVPVVACPSHLGGSADLDFTQDTS